MISTKIIQFLSGYGNLDNQCRDPMNNNKDCRVGQLTTAASARSTFFQLILTNSFRPECGNWSDESELMVERSAFWLEGILLVSVMVDMM